MQRRRLNVRGASEDALAVAGFLSVLGLGIKQANCSRLADLEQHTKRRKTGCHIVLA